MFCPEAESLLLQNQEALRGNEAVEPDVKSDALEGLIRIYETWEKPEKRAEWRRQLAAFNAAEPATKPSARAAKDSQ